MVVRRGQMRRIGWVIKTFEAQVGQFLLCCKCPVSRSFVVQDQDTFGELLAAFFLQNVHQLHQQRCVILRVDSLVLWRVIYEEDAALITKKNRGENFSSGFCTRNFWGGVSRYAATPQNVALFPGHSYITRSPIATGSHLDCAEKILNVAQTTGTVDVFDPRSGISVHTSAFRHFMNHFAKSFRMSRSS